MAPTESQPKKIEASSSGKGIRAFFGSGDNPSGQKVASKHFAKGLDKSSAIEIDDDHEDGPVLPKRKRPTVYLSSDDEDTKPQTQPKKKIVRNLTTAEPVKAKETSETSSGKRLSKKIITDAESDRDHTLQKKAVIPPKGKNGPSATNSLAKPSTIRSEKKEDNKKEKAKQSVNDTGNKSAPANTTKFNWAAAKAARAAGPSAPGSKQVPNGQPNCLAGLSFVFTGELSSFAREEAVDLAKRFGGRVVGQPSSVTSYVILGDNAGPSKLKAIQKHGLKTLNEDEFLNLIATRKGALDEKTRAKMAKEEDKIREAAAEMERQERKAEKAKAANHSSTNIVQDPKSQLWTVKYAPKTLKEICGNKGQVEKLHRWLQDFQSSLHSGFKRPGKDAMGQFKAVLITGPPGIGKTSSAHLCAKLAGYTPIELNASDARSKKLVENGANINNTSLDGWMTGGQATNAAGVQITEKSCLIMDEVDGMSAGDRGGVGALNVLIKKSKIPVICIANDRNAQKLKPLLSTTFNLTFRKPEAAAIRSRILTVAFKEKMKLPANVVDQLVEGAQSDIRQVLNMLQTWKLSNDAMDFDEGKTLAKASEKYTIMTPFNVTSKMLGPYLFSTTARETLGEKMEYYFHDHSFVPLFIQENYLKTDPAKLRNASGPEKNLHHLKLMEKASASISEGDVVDALIHGSEQHWSLMPLHSVMSTVRPASFVYGAGAHYGGPNSMTFPQWLGQNSKQGKLQRQLGDVQIRMRLRVSGDKPEIRQQYIPPLFTRIVRPLIDVGSSAVDEVITFMDDYYLSKDEWDTLVELGVDQNKDDFVLKKISSATKTSLTKKYNSSDHPIPFHKATDLGKIPKKIAEGPAPDIEDVFELDDEGAEDEPDSKGLNDDADISKDSLIKMSKPKGKGKGGTVTKKNK